MRGLGSRGSGRMGSMGLGFHSITQASGSFGLGLQEVRDWGLGVELGLGLPVNATSQPLILGFRVRF